MTTEILNKDLDAIGESRRHLNNAQKEEIPTLLV
ncbi:hypothetical protein IWX84_002815 [Flavobacterium sp. CG_9.10]|nr:hypothetical protein [Flavobacterium sp. CG_9.10]